MVRWGQLFRLTGSVSPKRMGGSTSRLEAHRDWLLARIAEAPSLTLEALRRELAERGVSVGYGSIWRFVDREKLTFKKSVRAAEQDRLDVAAARARWREEQPDLDPSHLVFIEETWAEPAEAPLLRSGSGQQAEGKTNMAPVRGRCPRGKRLVGKVPFGRWTTTTFVAGLKRRGATLRFLPPYSPDLNPIEMMFAKLKPLLRRAEERSVAALWDRIGTSLDHMSRQECANYFKVAGYAPK